MPQNYLPIRLSHVLGQSGVGAIVRGGDWLVVVRDIRQWTDRHGSPAGRVIPYVERVRAALEIPQQLREPPVAKELTSGQIDGVCVPATRFPLWAHCPACGTLSHAPWRTERGAEADGAMPHCSKCSTRPKLEQMTWVIVDPRGYLADVPWHDLAHTNARAPRQQACRVRDRLRLKTQGLERRLICDDCGASVQFRGDERQAFPRFSPPQPWSSDGIDKPNPMDPAQVMPINDARVHEPHADVVLVIPPESRVRKGTVVDRLYRNSRDRARIDGARTPLARKSAIKSLASEYRCTATDIEAALADIRNGYPVYGENFTPGLLRESEFAAFLEELPDQRDDEDLVIRDRGAEWQALVEAGVDSRIDARGIENLVRVDRLKAVKVFRGFTRMGGSAEPETENITPPDLVGAADWLPAVELYGEGVFITLDEPKVAAWEGNDAVRDRLGKIRPRFVRSGRREPTELTARFLLLHTLSHLLMRQIEAEGGYPAASLNERLYCATAPTPMAGILIHVAVPDVAGSLGGLAELAEPRRFLAILGRALEHARWCSLDPVCSEHEGQGPALLNRAACHACALVPDTACDYGNTLLDRIFVKGDSATGLPSFFGGK
jgi:hypothetical protein